VTPEALRRVMAGDAVAFAELVRAYGPKLRRMAMGFFHSPFEQEEAVQATKGPKRPKIPITDEDRARALAPAGLFLHLPCKMGNSCTFTAEFDPE